MDESTVRFALDSSLGALAKWLRILGFDSVYVPGTPSKVSLFCGTEDRIILTRTHRIQAENPGRHLLFIRHNDLRDQLIQVVSDLKLDFSDVKPFSRCIRCNSPVHEISREQIRSFVPDYVYETGFSFKKCPACERIYWPGSHVKRVMVILTEIFKLPES